MSGPVRLAVFASGGGTNLQALLDYFNARDDAAARVQLVIGSRTGIGALRRAEAASVPSVALDPTSVGGVDASEQIMAILDRHRIDLIALAGYLRLIPAPVVERFRGRIINIHPALLPGFGGPGMYGIRVHEAVLASGATVSGATVHLVDEKYDEGRILAQWPVPVLAADTPDTLAARVLKIEHLIYPATVERVARGGTDSLPDGEAAFDLIPAESPSPEAVRRLIR